MEDMFKRFSSLLGERGAETLNISHFAGKLHRFKIFKALTEQTRVTKMAYNQLPEDSFHPPYAILATRCHLASLPSI